MRPGALAVLTSLTLLAFSALAGADVLYLEGGGRVDGVVTEEAGLYVVRSVRGTARVRPADVVKHVRMPYVTEIYAERRDAVGPEDAEGRFLLALWCATHDLPRQARMHLEEVILIDPDHVGARARLGFAEHEGVWMRPEEARDAAMAARGYLRFEGRWFTPQGLKAWIEAKGDLALLQEEIAGKKAETAKAELEVRRIAEKLAKEEAERKAVEDALARAEADRKERDRLARQNEEILRLLRDMFLRSGIYGHTAYGYGVPHLGFESGSGGRSTCRPPGPQISFRWSRGNFHLRGLLR